MLAKVINLTSKETISKVFQTFCIEKNLVEHNIVETFQKV